MAALLVSCAANPREHGAVGTAADASDDADPPVPTDGADEEGDPVPDDVPDPDAVDAAEEVAEIEVEVPDAAGDPCLLDEPAPDFAVGPAILPHASKPGVGLSIHAVPTFHDSTLDVVAMLLTGSQDGIVELRVYARSGDTFKLEQRHTVPLDHDQITPQIITLEEPIVVPGLRHIGLWAESGDLAIGHASSGANGWYGASEDIQDGIGSLTTAAWSEGTPAWSARFIDTTPCKNGGSCTSLGDGTFVCDCTDAWAGPDCDDLVDPCASPVLNTCDDLAVCETVDGGFECLCPVGYEGDGTTCDDIDECASQDPGPCDPHAVCTNVVGGWQCACAPGFDGDGLSCADVDECADPTLNDCSESATCLNQDGDFTCSCLPGWTGDGVVCIDIDECADPELGCGDTADCLNLPGSFECVCKDGYYKDGIFCTDVDECADPALNDCAEDAFCYNESGSFSCQCHPGFVGDGTQCCGAPFASGETCETAFAICELPYQDSGLTLLKANNYGAGIKQCNSGVQGAVGGASNDLVYRYDPPVDQEVTFSLTGDFPTSLYLVIDCVPISQCIPDCTVLGSSCLAADSAGANETSEITVSLDSELTYFLVVDGEGSVVNLKGTYTLDVSTP